MRVWRDLKELRRLFGEMLSPQDVDEPDTFDLAVSARDFSRKATEVADDKLTFSATLMRAGEVDAANRLLAEAEEEVRAEEAALMESVNEVRMAQALKRERITRVRLARVLATAMLGSSLLAFSAIGMAIAGALGDDGARFAGPGATVNARRGYEARGTANGDDVRRKRTRVRIGGVKLALSPAQMRTYRELTATGNVDSETLEEFLMDVLPPVLAQQVSSAIQTTTATVEQAASDVQTLAARVVKVTKKKAKAKKEAAKTASSEPDEPEEPKESEESEEPSPTPSPSDGESPKDEESPGENTGDDDEGKSEADNDDDLPDPLNLP